MKLSVAALLTAIATLATFSARAQTPLQVDFFVLETGMVCGANPQLSSAETAVGTAINVGTALPGDCVEIRVRLRSREAQGVLLNPLSVSSTGTAPVFSAQDYPSLPYSIPRGTNVDFRLRFAPKDPGVYQGTFYLLDKRISLSATSPEGVTVQAQRAAALETLQTTSAPVDFGAVERKQVSVRQFALVNRTGRPLPVNSLFLTGNGYSIEGITAPLTLAAGATRTFAVRFNPQQSGILRAQLYVDGRIFALEGFAVEPPLPTLSFGPLPAARNGEQVTVKILLSETSRSIGSVKLSLEGIHNDPAVALLPAGGRTANLALKEGDRELSALIQTGTTAGTLKLIAEIGSQRIETPIVLAPLVPAIASITATRANGRIDLRISGFDNVRAMREAAFQFYDRTGAPISGTIRSAITDAFDKYFATSTLGGLFALTASFPVVGDINAVAGVEIELANNQGSARAAKITF